MKKRSLLIPALASAALLLASCDIMPPDFKDYSYPGDGVASSQAQSSSQATSSSSSAKSDETSKSDSSVSASASASTSSATTVSTSESSVEPVEGVVTATKNGEPVTLGAGTPGANDKAAYTVTLAVNDVLALKDGATVLHFYHWEGEGESGHAEDDGATFTATVEGLHKIFYGKDGKVWINNPEPEPSADTVEITITFSDSWAKDGGAVFYAACYEANWTALNWHALDANDKVSIPSSTENFIIVRMDPSKVSSGPNWDAKWNQSADIAFNGATTAYTVSLS